MALSIEPLEAAQMEVSLSLGGHKSQFEGAGPGDIVWESKPTHSAPFLSFTSLYRLKPHGSGWGTSYQNLLGKFASERIGGTNRTDEKRTETQTLSLYFQKPIRPSLELSWGIQAILQTYEYKNFVLSGTALPGREKRSMTRLGPRMGLRGTWRMLPQVSLDSQFLFSVLGPPHRPSFLTELEGAASLPIGSDWNIEAGIKFFLLQLERHTLEMNPDGFVFQWRQGTTDAAIPFLRIQKRFEF
ncbi:MAG: hypothetical protein HY402_06425 [Elusimicrobia bacterium]|nr:hypothetical protein [Elusimicrobiota bacterium]